MLRFFRDFFFVLIANGWGFLTPAMVYAIYLFLRRLGIEQGEIDPLLLQDSFVVMTNITWLVCGVFSLAFLFIGDKIRWFFLFSPVLFPFLYGFFTLLQLSV